MRFVTCQGYLFRLRERKYCAMLRAVIRGDPFPLAEHGADLGPVEDVTDLQPEEAREMLARATKPRDG